VLVLLADLKQELKQLTEKIDSADTSIEKIARHLRDRPFRSLRFAVRSNSFAEAIGETAPSDWTVYRVVG
jgi:hypothetical protein